MSEINPNRNIFGDNYVLPAFESFHPSGAQSRILTRSQWKKLLQSYTDIEIVRKNFEQVVARQSKRLETDRRHTLEQAREEGLVQAADQLIKECIKTVRTAKEQQDEIVQLMFAAIETMLGRLPSQLISAKLARMALNQQIDARSVIAVTVHDDALEQVSEQVAAWCDETSIVRVELNTDSSMSSTDCDIETSYGTVRAGLKGQLETLKNNLLQVAESTIHE